MLPAGRGARAFAGAIAQLAGYRAQRCRGYIDGDINRGRVFCNNRVDRDRRDQSGRDQGAPQVLDIGRLIDITGIKAGNHLDMIGTEQVGPVHDNRTEVIFAAGRDLYIEITEPFGMVDFQFRFCGFSKRIAIFCHRQIEPALGIHDPVAVDDLSRLQAKAFAEIFRIGDKRAFQTGQGDLVELILRPRLHVDDDLQPFVAICFKAALHDRVIIAFDPEQALDQLFVTLHPPPDLGEIGFVTAILFEDRQYVEAGHERFADRLGQAVKGDPVSGFGQRVGRTVDVQRGIGGQFFRCRLERLIIGFVIFRQRRFAVVFAFLEHRFGDLLEIRPFDAEIREFGQLLIRVERFVKFPLIVGSGDHRVGGLSVDRPNGRTHQQNNKHTEAATISDQTHCSLFSLG